MSAGRGASCDVAIAGGGMVGLSLAVALAGLPLEVVVFEPVGADAEEQPSFDSRTTALSAGSRRVLEGIGVWPLVAREATPIRTIHVSQRGAFGTARLTAAEQGLEALGYTIENRLLGRALRERAAAIPRFHQRRAAVRRVAPGAGSVRIETEDGERFDARLLVAADGAQSVVRRALDIEAIVAEYDQVAIVAHVDSTRFHDYSAFERFTASGPLAVLPIVEGRSAVVWTLSPDEARRVLALEDGDFLAELQRAFGMRVGRLTRVGRRSSYPLALTTAERLTAPRAVVLGNAAQSLHPVAGQGFNLALRDVAWLAELLASAAGNDPGAPELLERYASWRAPDREAVIRFTDSLVRAFGVPLASLRGLRGAGLALFDLLPPVKREFARRTMGLAGRQPRLVRGLPLATHGLSDRRGGS
jgi:2-octaprenyl-6-methoxyphenol hydroxylase